MIVAGVRRGKDNQVPDTFASVAQLPDTSSDMKTILFGLIFAAFSGFESFIHSRFSTNWQDGWPHSL
jgi:hypothetical protein